MRTYVQDRIGQHAGSWEVIDFSHTKGGAAHWVAVCKCGTLSLRRWAQITGGHECNLCGQARRATDSACPRHGTERERRHGNWYCKTCSAERARASYHRKSVDERRAIREARDDYMRRYQKSYNENNKDLLSAKAHKWYIANLDRVREYRILNHERISKRAHIRYLARRILKGKFRKYKNEEEARVARNAQARVRHSKPDEKAKRAKIFKVWAERNRAHLNAYKRERAREDPMRYAQLHREAAARSRDRMDNHYVTKIACAEYGLSYKDRHLIPPAIIEAKRTIIKIKRLVRQRH